MTSALPFTSSSLTSAIVIAFLRRSIPMDVSFARNGKMLGLYPDDGVPQLLEGHAVTASDYFWHEGMAEWQPIASKWESTPPVPLQPAPQSEIPAKR